MQDVSPHRVIVIGGGVAGLAAARQIQKSFQSSNTPLDLLVLEASSQPGGFLKSITREGFLLEMGPDCFISDKPRGVELCRELGLEADVIGTREGFRRSFILRNGKFHPVPEGFYLMGPSRQRPFLESRLLSWRGKLRALCEPLISSQAPNDESLASFVRRRFGQELLDWMAQPLIAGIYGADAEDLSLRATFPKFLEMERSYGSVLLGLKESLLYPTRGAVSNASGARYSLFVTLKRGMQSLADELTKQLGSSVIRCNTKALSIIKSSFPSGSGGDSLIPWQVRLINGEVLAADALCIALPSYAAAELVQAIDPELSADLTSIRYAPAATLNFAFREMDVKRPLNGVGFVVPQKEKRLILGCTFAQNKFDGRVPKGFMLLRAFLGGEQGAPWMHEKDEALTNKVFAELKEWLEISGQPLFTQLERYQQALPQYTLGHVERVLRIEERLFRHKGLSLAGNYQYGVGIPDCIASGERAAHLLLKQLTADEALSRA